ncbi:DUF7144 family membrane protein [Streptomyces sp. NBC_00286]|uniref:DUF7144 family membrane protein n=1 Tax=Streptomyces sp. NBC_00286 TaxID=2975701 RepID=UPI002E28A2DC|nr:hypothetical protein [Streptomyces sp. NBC_00286]
MTQTVHRRSPETMPAAAGLVVFAAVMLVIAGVLDIFRGIMGIADDDLFVATPQYVFRFDLTGWGWFHLILGFLGVLIGVSLFKAALWARIAGVAIAGFLIIANFLSLPYYPVWSIISIALYSFVIWALCVVRPGTITD